MNEIPGFDTLIHQCIENFSCASAEKRLRKKFAQDVRVVDWEKGYLSVPWINEVIDPVFQRLAAKVMVHLLKQRLGDRHITKVAGIPTMGTYMAIPTAEELNVLLAATRKSEHVPTRWEEAMVLKDNMKLYSNGKPASHIYNGLHPEDVVLFVDDVLGDGTTILPIINYMLDYGITPFVGVYAAKLYRPGYQTLVNMGIQPVYVYGIEEVCQNGNVVLSPPQIK